MHYDFLPILRQERTFIYGRFCYQWGHAVAQLVEALRYNPVGRGFDSRWCHWNFSLTIFLAALWP